MAIVSMKGLLETGVHFGHRTRKWNPRMKQYIFTERNGIHIIDLQQTLEFLELSYALVRDHAAEGGELLFVGTKRQAQETIQVEAERCNMPYVNARWLGGTLTNWRTIRARIDELERLEHQRDEGIFELLTKKEALTMTRKIDRLEERLGGIRKMNGVPSLLFVVDVGREETAVHEANLLKIPVIGLVDTNCNPSVIDYVIPSNDDAIRAIKLLTSIMADAVLEGQAKRKDLEEESVEAVRAGLEEQALDEAQMSDDELLGEATLAKLETGEYDEKEAREAEAAVVVEEAAVDKPQDEEPASVEGSEEAQEAVTEKDQGDGEVSEEKKE